MYARINGIAEEADDVVAHEVEAEANNTPAAPIRVELRVKAETPCKEIGPTCKEMKTISLLFEH